MNHMKHCLTLRGPLQKQCRGPNQLDSTKTEYVIGKAEIEWIVTSVVPSSQPPLNFSGCEAANGRLYFVMNAASPIVSAKTANDRIAAGTRSKHHIKGKYRPEHLHNHVEDHHD